jgi:hypothetical protein
MEIMERLKGSLNYQTDYETIHHRQKSGVFVPTKKKYRSFAGVCFVLCFIFLKCYIVGRLGWLFSHPPLDLLTHCAEWLWAECETTVYIYIIFFYTFLCSTVGDVDMLQIDNCRFFSWCDEGFFFSCGGVGWNGD